MVRQAHHERVAWKEDKALLLFFEERIRKIEKTKSKLEFFMGAVLKLI